MLEGLTDDQVALLGSAAAVFFSATLMVVTYSVRKALSTEEQQAPETVKVPRETQREHRRAA